MLDQRKAATRPFAEARSQCWHAQLQRLTDDIGLAEFDFGSRRSEVPGERW